MAASKESLNNKAEKVKRDMLKKKKRFLYIYFWNLREK